MQTSKQEKSMADKHIEQLKALWHHTTKSSNIENDLINIYRFIKRISPIYYKNGHMSEEYEKLMQTMIDENDARMPHLYIDKTLPRFSSSDETLSMFPTRTELLDYIVHTTRAKLLRYSQLPIQDVDFRDQCFTAGIIVKELCYKLGIEEHYYEINPGYSKIDKLMLGNGYHVFNIINFGGDMYLIDCTYRQFFTLEGNVLERMGIPYSGGCYVGVFMMMNKERLQLAQKLIRDGWIKLDDELFKTYLDGFTLSYRNGLYYEQTKDFSFTTPYTIDDYANFLNNKDNQINHEGIEVLGYQLRPLENPQMRIRAKKS